MKFIWRIDFIDYDIIWSRSSVIFNEKKCLEEAIIAENISINVYILFLKFKY